MDQMEIKEESSEKKLVRNIVYLGVVQFVNYLLPLISLPFLTKMLSAEEFGKVILMYSIAMLALVVSEFGFNITGPYFVAKNAGNKDQLLSYYNNVLVVKFLVSLLFGLCFLIINSLFRLYNFTLVEMILIFLLIIIQAFQFSWFFQGIEKMSEITRANVVSKISYFIMILIAVPFVKQAIMVILLFVIAQIILAIMYQKSLKCENMNFDKKNICIVETKKLFLSNISFFVSRLAVIGYTMLNSMIVGVHEGLKVVAVYGIAEKLYQVTLGILSPITQAFYPYMIKNKKYRLLFLFLLIGFIFLATGCYVLYLIDEMVITYIFGAQFTSVGQIMPYFYILILIVFLSMNIGHPLLGAIGRLKEVNYSVYFGFIAFMSLLFFRDYSLNTLLENIIIAEVVVFLIRLAYVLIYMKEMRLRRV